jgi:ubiquinone/menaquinone biosynthesis C-methylase UbiE
MSQATIRFDDGAAYERMMGGWSRLVGAVFLDWLALPRGLRWLDVGCGNGAFSEVVVDRCAPASVDGIDPSEAQLAYARARPEAAQVRYRQGDAMALPYGDDAFDVALMALVIFFVPDPAKGVAEMVRVVRPGGTVAAYAWDMHGGGFPHAALASVLRDMGTPPPKPPSVDASKIDAMRALWHDAGIEAVETREIVVERTFADFDDLWTTSRSTSSLAAIVDKASPADVERIRAQLRERLPADAAGRITHSARANAVKGRLPR